MPGPGARIDTPGPERAVLKRIVTPRKTALGGATWRLCPTDGPSGLPRRSIIEDMGNGALPRCRGCLIRIIQRLIYQCRYEAMRPGTVVTVSGHTGIGR